MYLSDDCSILMPSVKYDHNDYGWGSNIVKAVVWSDFGVAYRHIRAEYYIRPGCIISLAPSPPHIVEELTKL